MGSRRTPPRMRGQCFGASCGSRFGPSRCRRAAASLEERPPAGLAGVWITGMAPQRRYRPCDALSGASMRTGSPARGTGRRATRARSRLKAVSVAVYALLQPKSPAQAVNSPAGRSSLRVTWMLGGWQGHVFRSTFASSMPALASSSCSRSACRVIKACKVADGGIPRNRTITRQSFMARFPASIRPKRAAAPQGTV